MKKILFILPSLKAGGAERVISFISQHLDRRIFDVTLLIQGFEKDQVFNVNNINLIFLNKPRLFAAIPAIFKYIWKTKPHIVVGSIIHINLFLGFISLFFQKIKFVAREASVSSLMDTFSQRRVMPLFLRKFLYRRLDLVICQSSDMKIDFQDTYNIPDSKCVIINNPITIHDCFSAKPRKENNIIKFITIGRLSREKGHERILRNIAKLDTFEFHYLLIGNGPLKSDINDLILDLRIGDRVQLIDYESDVRSYLLSSDFFLQGSYVEGFPNALLEAVSLGIPVIAYDAPGGTREIIKEGLNGFFIKNESDFSSVLERALNTTWDSAKIKEDAQRRFAGSSIIKKYEDIFLKLNSC